MMTTIFPSRRVLFFILLAFNCLGGMLHGRPTEVLTSESADFHGALFPNVNSGSYTVHHGSPAFERSRYWLNLTDNTGFFGQMMVAYMTGATNGYDPGIDGLFFGDSQTALTSIIDGQEYVIQGRAIPFDPTDVVTLGFKSELGGAYTIALNSFDGLFETTNQDIYLKDNLANTLTNLKLASYSFMTAAGVFNNRFEVVYVNTLSISDPAEISNTVIVYQHQYEVIIHSGSEMLSKVQLYDISGRLLAERDHLNTHEARLDAGMTKQVLVVKITTAENEIVTRKIVN